MKQVMRDAFRTWQSWWGWFLGGGGGQTTCTLTSWSERVEGESVNRQPASTGFGLEGAEAVSGEKGGVWRHLSPSDGQGLRAGEEVMCPVR